MRVLGGWLSCLLLSEAAWCGQRPVGQARAVLPATIEGRITVVLIVNRTRETNPLRSLPVYLFAVEDSRPLQALQRRCRGALAQPRMDPVSVYETCRKCLAEAAELVPRLPATATTQTDREGFYRFDNVPALRRYQVVGVKVEEDEPIVIVGLTPRLRSGQRVALDLSENDPWTSADPLRD